MVLTYDYADLNKVALAWAKTIHKSQGSEYPVVILPFYMQYYMMLSRNLVYSSSQLSEVHLGSEGWGDSGRGRQGERLLVANSPCHLVTLSPCPKTEFFVLHPSENRSQQQGEYAAKSGKLTGTAYPVSGGDTELHTSDRCLQSRSGSGTGFYRDSQQQGVSAAKSGELTGTAYLERRFINRC